VVWIGGREQNDGDSRAITTCRRFLSDDLLLFWRAFSAAGDMVGQMVFCIFMTGKHDLPLLRDDNSIDVQINFIKFQYYYFK